jgi:ABC-type uncharacterized transport system auxiliary subunit
MRSAVLVCTIAVTGMLLTACVKSRPIKYYRIEVLALSPAAAGTVFDVTLQIGNIEAPPLMRDGRILYQIGTHEMGAYEYHRWVETPDQMVQNALVRLLRSSGKFRAVDTPRSNVKADYILRGKVYDFAEIDKPQIHTRVSMEIELHDSRTNRLVWSRLYTDERLVDGEKIPDVVQSLDQNLRQGLTEIVNSLEQYFASQANNSK